MAATERDADAIRRGCARILNGDPAHRQRLAQLERMPEYYAWMLAFADAVRGDERIVLQPDPPAPFVHVNVRAEWETMQEAVPARRRSSSSPRKRQRS
jgi:hypothetical protein